MTEPLPDDAYSEAETATRREAMLRTLLATPHKPQRPKRQNAKATVSRQSPKTERARAVGLGRQAPTPD